MEFVLVNKFFRVGKTEVSIQCDKPFTFFTRELEGDHLGDTDETLIEAVKEILRTELDPTSAIVKNQEQLAKTTEALEKANQLMEGMQKVNLQNAQDIEDILARLEELEAQGEPDQAEKEEAEEETPQVTDTEKQADEAEPAPAQPTTEQPVAEAPTQPTPAVEDNKESEKEDDISETTNQESPSEDNGGSSNE